MQEASDDELAMVVVDGPIRRREELRPRPDADLEGVLSALERGFDLTSDAQGPLLTRVVDGRMLLANYDPDQASEDDLNQLWAEQIFSG